MIKSVFTRGDDGRIVSFEISGHADAGPYGSDVVCAAVSALAVSTVNGVDALAGFQPLVDLNEEDGGHLYMETLANVNQEQVNISQILLENFYLAMTTMAVEYADFVSIQVNQKGGTV